MTILYLICLLYFVLGGGFHIVGSIVSMVNLHRTLHASPEEHSGDENLILIVPVYKEQQTVTESLEFFSRFTDKMIKACYFVTTERERIESTITTHDIIQSYLSSHLNCPLQLVEAPKEYEGKAGQINYVLHYLHVNNLVCSFDYIVIYDVDSRPMPVTTRVFRMMLDLSTKNGEEAPCVFQQLPLYSKNLDKLGWKRFASINDAICQSQWCIGFEYPLLRVYQKAVNAHRLVPLIYCIGHGCFISVRFLERIGGIPTINKNDDLSLGYLLSSLRDKVVPLPMVDFCDTAPSLHDSIKQSMGWAKGSFHFWRDIHTYLEHYRVPMSIPQRVLLWVEGNLRGFLWAYRGFLLLFIFLFPVFHPAFWTATIMAMVLYCTVPYLLTCICINSLKQFTPGISWTKSLTGALCAPFSLARRSIGPFFAQFLRRDYDFKVRRL
jgi:hypothetical protein